MHDAPPQLGAGLLQERVRVRVAGPQLDDHDPTVHDVHAPLAAFVRKILEYVSYSDSDFDEMEICSIRCFINSGSLFCITK